MMQGSSPIHDKLPVVDPESLGATKISDGSGGGNGEGFVSGLFNVQVGKVSEDGFCEFDVVIHLSVSSG